jgi:hypothetical protein
VVERARGWVGRGHRAQVGPPLVPICGMRDPIEGEKRGSDKGGGRRLGERKEKGRERGWQLGKGKRGG